MKNSFSNFDAFSSRTRRIYIPLPNYKLFHRPSDIHAVDDNYVEKPHVVDKLKQWLRDDYENIAGSYLVTGFRGMGKTSFVGKVIKDLIDETRLLRHNVPVYNFYLRVCIVLLPFIIPVYFICEDFAKPLSPYALIIGLLLFVSFILFSIYGNNKTALNRNKISILKKYKTRYILPVNLNIGNEVNGVHDVLSLLAHTVKERYSDYINNQIIYDIRFAIFEFTRYFIAGVIWSFIMVNGISILSKAYAVISNSTNDWFRIIIAINEILLELKDAHSYIFYLLYGILTLGIALWFVNNVIFQIIIKFIRLCKGKFTSPKEILQNLDHLIVRINASIDEDNTSTNTVNAANINVNLFPKKTKKYQPATVREIEEELKCLINEITDSVISNCRFIFVLDELDKFDMDSDKSTNQVESIKTDNKASKLNRQFNVFKLLGQLKYFTTNTKAKFIFIAGHELYDAYLADVSDREFFVSSMFNGVLNIDSFFTKNARVKDITILTEEYVCRAIMGEKVADFLQDNETYYTLKNYIGQLNKCIDPEYVLNEKEKEKLGFFLKQFITYLTFVSNGAPKKLTTLFHSFVITKERYESTLKGDESYLCINPSKNNCDYYLAFGFNDQQKIGFINYLADPIFKTIINQSSEYGDKLLVSSAFMIAHIYKLHNGGFSWRNLEYLPELIDRNKTPELREYLSSILGYLSRLHITSITSGIHDYKFPLKLSEEISVFTKKSEDISAIFNFSLDDTREAKNHFEQLLKSNNERQSDIANIYHYLADIHMSCEEYSEAIVQYKLASDIILRDMNLNNNDSNSSCIVRYTRVMLKLGLCYEKRHTYDSAYVVYNDLTLKLIQFRDVDVNKLGLTDDILPITKNTDSTYESTMRSKVVLTPRNKYAYCDNNNKYYPTEISESQLKDTCFWIKCDDFTDNLADFLNPTKATIISKLSVFDDLRIAYLSILTKLLAVEKYNICGITKENIKVAESEFDYLFLVTNGRSKYLLEVDFYRKLGDILFYKNKNFYNSDTIESAYAAFGFDIKLFSFNYCFQHKYKKELTSEVLRAVTKTQDLKFKCDWNDIHNDEYSSNVKDVINKIYDSIPKIIRNKHNSIDKCCKNRKFSARCSNNIEPQYKNNCTACRFYNRSLLILKNNIIDETIADSTNFRTKALKFLYAIKENKISNISHNDLMHVALSLEAMGNIALSCNCAYNTIDMPRLLKIFSNDLYFRRCYYEVDTYSNIERAILYYWTSREYYKKALNLTNCQCFIKILNILVTYCAKHTLDLNTVQLTAVFEPIVLDSIKSLCKAKGFNGIIEIKEMKDVFSFVGNVKKVNLGYTSISAEVEELILAYYELKLQIIVNKGLEGLKEVKDDLKILYHSPWLNYLRNESLTYNRVISLLFKENMNKLIFDQLYNNSEAKNDLMEVFKYIFCVDKIDEIEFKIHLISDSIFCLSNIMDYVSPSKRTTLFSDSFCGMICEKMSWWIDKKDGFQKNDAVYKYDPLNNNETLANYIKRVIGRKNMNLLSKTYYNELKIKHYDNAIAMNSEGKPYQDMIKKFYVIDDNLQNNTCQFYLALERYKINSYIIQHSSNKSQRNDYFAPESFLKWPEH